MGKGPGTYWLMKSEPDVYSVNDLAADRVAEWEGVRNYQARNHMRDMRVGDLVLYYHSNARPPGVAGIARIHREAYPDDTQFDPKHRYFDARSKPEEPRWDRVDLEHVETFSDLVPLDALKENAKLAAMLVIRKGMRLSVQPVEKAHFKAVLRMANATTKVR
jgi:predicted RNA-binding protein with PUA-like domain